jgi:hypothetical protein
MRHRLVWPAARPLHVRGGAAIEHRGAVDVYTWTRNNVEAIDDEDSTPDWYDGFDSVQVSEFASWAEVAKWSEEMFRPDLASQAEVAAIADKIRGEHPTRDAQITAAIRFVQDDIRYLGIEMGRGSHEPRQPRATLEQRYGDCKDKAFLLAQLLQRLGVEAHPAMVNTKLRHRLDEFLPSPFLFDHAITEVIDGKHTYWIDGTIAEQGGRLETIDTPNDERALVVSTTTTALSKIDTHNRANTTIDETYDIHGDDAALAVTTTYRGRDADDLRADLATRSAAEYAKERINLFASDHPRIERVAAPSITDDRDGDSIIVRERYVIHRIWKDGTWTFAPRAIEDHLARPDTLIRSMPLAVDYPLDVVENVTIHGGVISDADDVVTDTPALHYERHAGNGTVTWRLQTKKDAVSAREVADHLSTLNTLDDELGVTVRGRAQMASMSPWVVSPAVAIVLVVLTAVMSRRRRGITSQ